MLLLPGFEDFPGSRKESGCGGKTQSAFKIAAALQLLGGHHSLLEFFGTKGSAQAAMNLPKMLVGKCKGSEMKMTSSFLLGFGVRAVCTKPSHF